MSKTLKIAAVAAAPVIALTLMAAPASAQSYRDHDRRDRDDNSAQNALIGAAVGGLAGALFGNGDGTYIAGGALAGAALGAATSGNDNNCDYYRGGRCYRNQGHWEREHGIDRSRSGYDYRYDNRRRDDRRYNARQDNRRYDRDYRYDRRW